MTGKKIIIVGASSGLGSALASKYASLGCRVGITARRAVMLEQLAEKYPGNILTSAFDISTDDNATKIRELIERLGGLDLLVFCAGSGTSSELIDPEVESQTVRTTVNGFLEIADTAFLYFMEQGHGQLAVISSIAGVRGNGRAPAYSAAKAFLSNYAEGLNHQARRLRKKIVITDIRPGFLDTKPAAHKRFWIVPVDKAVEQILRAIERKKTVAYISRRWRLVAGLIRILPASLYHKI